MAAGDKHSSATLFSQFAIPDGHQTRGSAGAPGRAGAARFTAAGPIALVKNVCVCGLGEPEGSWGELTQRLHVCNYRGVSPSSRGGWTTVSLSVASAPNSKG